MGSLLICRLTRSLLLGIVTIVSWRGSELSAQCTPKSYNSDTSFGTFFGCNLPECPTNDILSPFHEIDITRVVSPDESNDGALNNPDIAIQNGIVSPYACANLDITYQLATDDVVAFYFNGKPLRSISIPAKGLGVTVHVHDVLMIPIQYLHFATFSSSPSQPAPNPGRNVMEVVYDRPGIDDCNICGISVMGGPITFYALAPIILVHGTRASPNWFNDSDADNTSPCGANSDSGKVGDGFVRPLQSGRYPVVCQSIQLTNSNYLDPDFKTGAATLKDMMKAAGVQYGTHHFHLVGHSNGGNWIRTMLSTLNANDNVWIYSVTTISTPFSGTALADMAQAGIQSLRFRMSHIAGLAGWWKGLDDAELDSQTAYAREWNRSIIHPLRTTVTFTQTDLSAPVNEVNDVEYYAVVTNADANHNWVLDTGTSEVSKESFANQRFQLLANIDSIRTCALDSYGKCPKGSSVLPSICTVPSKNNGTTASAYKRPNDVTVTIFSAQWPNTLDMDPQTARSCYTDLNGKLPPFQADQAFTLLGGNIQTYNHHTIGNPAITPIVIQAIREAQSMK